MMKVLFLMLCSGILQFSLAAYRLRNFIHLKKRVNQTDGLKYCKSEGGSLLSLYDKEDAKIGSYFYNDTEYNNQKMPFKAWVGLKWKSTSNLTWSNGKEVTFNNSLVNLNKGEQLCEAIENGTWKGFNCSEEKAFMCQNGSNYTFVDIEKNWCQAMQHCRTHYEDLASIDSENQNEELRIKSQAKSCWIGLQHDELEWADNSCSTNKDITRILKGPDDSTCFYFNPTPPEPSLIKHHCENQEHVICSRGRVKIKVINEHKTWEKALNYCAAKHSRLLWIDNKEDQEAVVHWLKITNSTKRFWIGLRQSIVFGFWIWSDQIVHYHNWENGKQPEMPLSNHCGVIDAETYKWTDENCWSELPFLCEEDIIYMKE